VHATTVAMRDKQAPARGEPCFWFLTNRRPRCQPSRPALLVLFWAASARTYRSSRTSPPRPRDDDSDRSLGRRGDAPADFHECAVASLGADAGALSSALDPRATRTGAEPSRPQGRQGTSVGLRGTRLLGRCGRGLIQCSSASFVPVESHHHRDGMVTCCLVGALPDKERVEDALGREGPGERRCPRVLGLVLDQVLVGVGRLIARDAGLARVARMPTRASAEPADGRAGHGRAEPGVCADGVSRGGVDVDAEGPLCAGARVRVGHG
jgi:hypothetical protein